jgi:hypothetical protein
MTGIKQFTGSDKDQTLTMKLPRNRSGANYLTIKLEWNDTYTMTFEKVRMVKQDPWIVRTVVARPEMVYNDQLRGTFTQVTGLYTSLRG